MSEKKKNGVWAVVPSQQPERATKLALSVNEHDELHTPTLPLPWHRCPTTLATNQSQKKPNLSSVHGVGAVGGDWWLALAALARVAGRARSVGVRRRAAGVRWHAHAVATVGARLRAGAALVAERAHGAGRGGHQTTLGGRR